VSLVDVPATLLDLAGLLPEREGGRFGDGLSLRPLLDRGGSFERDAPLVAQLERKKQGRAFLLEQWPRRLVEVGFDYAGTKDRTSLFDLEDDPEEREDLAARDPAATAGLLRSLQARRAALQAQALQAEGVPLDPELREQMDRLGYGAAGTGGAAGEGKGGAGAGRDEERRGAGDRD
jgi:arylsulfatase A-like enzyme